MGNPTTHSRATRASSNFGIVFSLVFQPFCLCHTVVTNKHRLSACYIICGMCRRCSHVILYFALALLGVTHVYTAALLWSTPPHHWNDCAWISLCKLKYIPSEGILPVGLLPLPSLGNQVSFWFLKVVWCTRLGVLLWSILQSSYRCGSLSTYDEEGEIGPASRHLGDCLFFLDYLHPSRWLFV